MGMKIITINLPTAYLDYFDQMIEEGVYKSRSHALRVCLFEFLEKEKVFRESLNFYPQTHTNTIITINVEKTDIKTMYNLVGFFVGGYGAGNGLYTSRSELFRAAARDHIVKEMYIKNNNPFLNNPELEKERKKHPNMIVAEGSKYYLNKKRNEERTIHV